MEKLVRDKIPKIVRAKGEEYPIRIASSDDEYAKFLRAKLLEELLEFLEADEAHKIEELADIMEVICAGATFHNISMDEIERVRREKFDKRGGFEKRIIWINKKE